MTNDDLYKYANTLKEQYRVNIENLLESGPEEFSWIYTPIKQNVESAIKVLFKGLCPNIEIIDKADDSFIQLEKLSFDSDSEQKKITEHT
jgi:hypothetical protein